MAPPAHPHYKEQMPAIQIYGVKEMKFSTVFVSATKDYNDFWKHVNAPCFRKEFEQEDTKSAELTICGLGLYELFINGKQITKGHLSPYISNPDQVLYYDNYDLLPYLQPGRNVIGIILGNGMLNCPGGAPWTLNKTPYRSAPKLALQYEAESLDGRKSGFTASDGFKCAPSPILFDDLHAGEFYDARLEQPGWNRVGFDDSGWSDPIPADTPRGEPRLCNIIPIRTKKTVTPVSIRPGKISKVYETVHPGFDMSDEAYLQYTEFSPREDGFLYDFGINSAGKCRIRIKNAKPGQKLVLQFGEMLTDDGGLDLRAMPVLPRAYLHRAIYICRGGEEEWSQMFTYFGFRYVLVMGLEQQQATEDLLTYELMHSDLTERSTFSCSDEVINKLWHAVLTSDYSNFYHFPTDCPHREKLGWTGDVSLSAEQFMIAFSAEQNLSEWLYNVRKAMRDDGALPCIVPTTSTYGFDWGAGPAWDAAIINVPYYVWKYRGDKSILEENATAIFRYIHYISTRRDEKGLIRMNGLGDWAPAARKNALHYQAPLVFTDTAICVDICKKASTIFQRLGMEAQKQFVEMIGRELRTSARRYLLDLSSMTAHGRCQTTQAMAIAYGLFDEAEKQRAFEQLLEIIHNDKDSIYCGVLGTRVLFQVLSDFGRTDLAYEMITKPNYPSYGYMMRLYDASLWESFRPWESTPNSLNHHFQGHIITWFLNTLAGIRINPYDTSPKEVLLAPRFVNSLKDVCGSHSSPFGTIKAEWHRDGAAILYSVSVPHDMHAELHLENGWKTEDGYTWKEVSGTMTYRIIRENADDIERLTSAY